MSRRLPVISGRELIDALRRTGFKELRHVVATSRSVTLTADVPPYLSTESSTVEPFRGIMRDAAVSRAELDRLH